MSFVMRYDVVAMVTYNALAVNNFIAHKETVFSSLCLFLV